MPSEFIMSIEDWIAPTLGTFLRSLEYLITRLYESCCEIVRNTLNTDTTYTHIQLRSAY